MHQLGSEGPRQLDEATGHAGLYKTHECMTKKPHVAVSITLGERYCLRVPNFIPVHAARAMDPMEHTPGDTVGSWLLHFSYTDPVGLCCAVACVCLLLLFECYERIPPFTARKLTHMSMGALILVLTVPDNRKNQSVIQAFIAAVAIGSIGLTYLRPFRQVFHV